MVSFKVTKKDAGVIRQIVDRTMELYRTHLKMKPDRKEIEMDITAVHANGCPLNLRKLLDADYINFVHDVWGIRRHIDRETGQLMNHFLPRCSMPETETAHA